MIWKTQPLHIGGTGPALLYTFEISGPGFTVEFDVDIVSVGNNPYSDLSRSVYVRAYSGRETIYKNNMNISTFTMGIPEIIDEILESVR